MGRVSLWSLNRDTGCSASFADVAVHSDTCSGVDQEPLAFVDVFAGLAGEGPAVRISDVGPGPDRRPVVDDPATSPYPIWRAEGQYPAGYKVVWHGDVYEARWYTAGSTRPCRRPRGPRRRGRCSGAGDHDRGRPRSRCPTVTDVTGSGTPTSLYQRGDRVLLDGLPYEARWASRSEAPGTLFPIGPDEAWEPLFTIPGEPAGT